jgi:hypothetical protein
MSGIGLCGIAYIKYFNSFKYIIRNTLVVG